MRQLGLSRRIDHCSLTSLQQRLVRTGDRLVNIRSAIGSYWPRGHLTRRVFGDDMPADLGVTAAGGVLAGSYSGETLAKEKRDGRGVSENCAKTDLSYRLAPTRKGQRPPCPEYWYSFRRPMPKKWLQSRRSVIYSHRFEAKNENLCGK